MGETSLFGNLTLRRFSPGSKLLAGRFERFQHCDQRGNLFMSSDSAEVSLGYEQSGADPALAQIAAVPAFHVATDCFDDREDDVLSDPATFRKLRRE